MTNPIAKVVAYEFDRMTLRTAGIRTAEKLLQRAGTPKGRTALSLACGIPTATLLAFVTIADLLRIKGLGADYIELLHRADVRTVRELKYLNPDNLHLKLIATNEQHKLVQILPAKGWVHSWIAQAKTLPIEIRYR